MILDRILKGFWGRYALYLSAFVALYFLMREKLDSIIFGLWDSWITVGEHPRISLYLFCLLSLYPIYRMLKYDKKKQMVDAAHVAYLFIPISVWYLIQRIWVTNEISRFSSNTPLVITFCFTVTYSLILILLWLKRPRVDKEVKSLLIKDEPIKDENNDELGFTLYAEPISKNICSIVNNKHSFVFGIEGSWGSGKTSFVNLVKELLEKHSHIRLLDFNPWMSGSAQQMTTDFFSLMAENTSSMRLRIKFREYGNALASADGTGIVGKIVESISPSQDLGTMLESINECIAREQLRFVVFIDDTDRLDKEELLSVFKLVRNTASFRNTIFVLTYDRNYVDSLLTSYFENSSIAEAYTDKIVNFQFELPSSSKDYYEILKKEINDSEFIKAHPEIRLNDGDLPKEITNLFDCYRKVKRIFNALAVESGLPHFEKIPVKYTLVFFYMAFYQKEDYEMVKEAYINNNWLETSSKDNSSQVILRLFEKANSITRPANNTIYGNYSDLTEELKQKRNAYDNFRDKHLCVYSLFEPKDNTAFIKYLVYLFKFNAIHYKEYKERYETYGIDGFKGIELNLSNANKILNRLLIIRDNFDYIFYRGCANDIFYTFTTGYGKTHIGENDLEPYFEFLIALSLSTDNPYNNIGSVLHSVNLHYENYKNRNANLLAILEKLDETDNRSSDPYIQHYIKIDSNPNSRILLKTITYLELTKLSGKHILFDKTEVIKSARKHLKNLISRKNSYELIEYAFFACGGIDSKVRIRYDYPIDEKACSIFRQYITQYPDGFIENCILDHSAWEGKEANSLHPLLMQIFDNKTDEIRQYFNTIKCESKKSQLMLKMINKYLDAYLQIDKEQNPYMTFSIPQKDRISIFNYENMYKSDTNEQ